MFSKDLPNYVGFPDDHKKCSGVSVVFVYYDYEVINRDLNKRLMYECRCDERLKVKTERSTPLTYTWCTRDWNT